MRMMAVAIAIIIASMFAATALAASAPPVPQAAPAPIDVQALASTALERMARANFGELGAAELQFVRHAPYRDLVWSSPSSDPDNPANDALNPRHRRASDKPATAVESLRETLPARMLRWYLWLHILAGWTITPLLFAGLAGLLRNG
jgi:hypothetical protein